MPVLLAQGAGDKARPQKENHSSLLNQWTRLTPSACPTEPRPKSNNTQKSYAEATKPKKTFIDENDPTTSKAKSIEEMLLKQAEKFDVILQQMSMLINLITTLVTKISQ
ncbi:unnamed protein product, partial [Brenthis ino]